MLLLAVSGCGGMSGTTSLTSLSRTTPADLEPVGEEQEIESCVHWSAILALWGEGASHETLTARLLEQTESDALIDAHFESTEGGVPYIYYEFCNSVRGKPARYKSEEAGHGS